MQQKTGEGGNRVWAKARKTVLLVLCCFGRARAVPTAHPAALRAYARPKTQSLRHCSAQNCRFALLLPFFDKPPAPPPCPLPCAPRGAGRGSNCAYGASRRLRVAFSARPRARKCATLTGGSAALLGGSPRDLAARLPPNERRSNSASEHTTAATKSRAAAACARDCKSHQNLTKSRFCEVGGAAWYVTKYHAQFSQKELYLNKVVL